MKRTDLYFAIVMLAIFLPFFLSADIYAWYKTFNAEHAMIMAFLKFGILATLGEMLGCRISTGNYTTPTFGVLPRMVVWGVLGMAISMAMTVFSSGIPTFITSMGGGELVAAFAAEGFSWGKLIVAFSISVMMNTFFAPVFMTFHKITDAHIAENGGSLKALITPIDMRRQMVSLNWDRQWSFIFKKTIPLFWYPAHTITFMLPGELRVLFAALLGVALGVILAIGARKK
ncbi:MAG: hypothetical protein IJB03_00580 [Alistipes sp.]|nr:hypothetical protein [Alistipes sp.]MBQ3248140.1 hypothetical protein [Alistipes sp.]